MQNLMTNSRRSGQRSREAPKEGAPKGQPLDALDGRPSKGIKAAKRGCWRAALMTALGSWVRTEEAGSEAEGQAAA